MKNQDFSGIASLVLTTCPSQKLVLLFVATQLDKGTAEISSAVLERYLRLSHRTVSLACAGLKRLGVMSWTRGTGRKPNVYALDRPRMVALVAEQTHQF
jgi:hypothetical protein